MPPLTLSSLKMVTQGEFVGEFTSDVALGRVEIDSRIVRPGSIFWALPGEHHDGHEFVNEAWQRGALVAVVQRDKLDLVRRSSGESVPPTNVPLLVVKNPLSALTDLARWRRSLFSGLVIGVTGSFGKTTTREMIHAVLSTKYRGTRSLKNFNNHIGLPLSLLELHDSHDFAVLEMGASAVGEIAMLADIAKPSVGVITGIGLAHVEGFGSPERIVLGKGELLEALPRDGLAVLPIDDPLARTMSHRSQSRTLWVGEGDNGHIQATNVRVANQQLIFEVDRFEYQVPVTGRHFLRAALTSLAIAREMGLSSDQIAEGFQNFRAAPGRCEVHRIGSWTVIDDSYNANPSSMRAACETLRDWETAGKRLLVTGDMLELGTHAEQAHHELGLAAAQCGLSGLLILGEHADQVARGAFAGGMNHSRVFPCEKLDDMKSVLDAVLEPHDVLLIKGSRGMRMERVIEWLRQRETSLAQTTTTDVSAVLSSPATESVITDNFVPATVH